MSRIPYSQQKKARQQNISVLLQDLWFFAPLSRANLAERNGLTKATISAIVKDLMDLGLIRNVGMDQTGLGRPGQLLEFDPQSRAAIGVEISTNYSAAVLTNLCGQALWQRAIPFAVGSSLDFVLDQTEMLIGESINQACGHTGLGPLLGIGMGVPGMVDPGDESLVTTQSLGWKQVPLKKRFETRFALPVIVDNRARAAAVVESLHGNAQGVDSYIYVSLGTDVGSSIEAAMVTNGLAYSGSHGMALDAGHMILDPNGPLCSCGQRGCWQVMADVGREVELISPRLAAGEDSVLQSLFNDSGVSLGHRDIHQAALEGDPLALDVVRQVYTCHAVGITNLVRLFDPEMVVIGWAGTALPEAFITRMKKLGSIPELDVPAAVLEHLAQRGAAPPSIVYALHFQDACSLGAAALIVDDFMRKPPIDEV